MVEEMVEEEQQEEEEEVEEEEEEDVEAWLWPSHDPLVCRYKKNLKALYVVHPTNFIRIVWNIFKPLLR